MFAEPSDGIGPADAVSALVAAEALAPGSRLAAACESLAAVPMGAAEAIRLATLWERVVSWASVQQMRVQRSVLEGAGRDSHDADALVSELAAASALSDATMSNQLGSAIGITAGLPSMAAAVEAGDLSIRHARALDAIVGDLEPDLREQVESLIVPLVVEKRMTPFQVRKAAEHAVLRLDPDGAAERREQAKKRDSDVRYRSLGDGLAELTAVGDDVLLRQVADAIDVKARELAAIPTPAAVDGDVHGDAGQATTPAETPIGVRRVNAMARLVLGDEQVDRPTVEIAVTIDYRSLLGLTDIPAIVSGVGVIPSAYARQLAADGMWRRLVTNPMTGQCLDLGRQAYRPSAGLQRLVRAVHGTCRFPGCSRPARKADLDHIINFGPGGTDRDNLHPLCRRHHNLKTRCQWRVDRHADGTETWTSPTATTYTSEPADYRDLFAPDATDVTDDPKESSAGADPPLQLGPNDGDWLAILFAESQDFDSTDPELIMVE